MKRFKFFWRKIVQNKTGIKFSSSEVNLSQDFKLKFVGNKQRLKVTLNSCWIQPFNTCTIPMTINWLVLYYNFQVCTVEFSNRSILQDVLHCLYDVLSTVTIWIISEFPPAHPCPERKRFNIFHSLHWRLNPSRFSCGPRLGAC